MALIVRSLLIIQCVAICVSALAPRNECQPATFNNKRSSIGISANNVNCRYTTMTSKLVSEFTCSEIVQKYQIALRDFHALNPEIGSDCKNVQPDTAYCVFGFMEPLRAWDGKCGPSHGNASCLGTDKQCCNSKTFTCGNSQEDCATGVCYSGACQSALQFGYSLDGKCGPAHDNKICGGVWGSCCNKNGQCGSGDGFCTDENCFSGECVRTPEPERRPVPGVQIQAPWQVGSTPDGTCGGPNHYTCDVVFGTCCGSKGVCGSVQQCDEGCQTRYGKCNNGSAVVYHGDYGRF
ncbi:carbohydrate-binding module family 18 protein [Dissoconium aciculare CBS 342.82]|uniref:Carbohydrate-binding module family 18 protein n=1 Tax=Dissoconium aciculare CBS 342.82 TaxID=1314786 RepID=A0A6J3LR33_9PEZI|nr:carbohydrate-binding module family 18 protein [Dissoconium aciculare CBS 342.82]KAF1817734.1 carbohydrate-binding module family 18 protein [Dissoconium aciculare CBS 342.82]